MNALRDEVETEAKDTRMSRDAPPSAIPHPRWRIFGLIVVQIIVGWMGIYIAWSAGRYPSPFSAAFLGVIFSQVSLLGIWGSLGASPWWKRVIGVVVGIGYLVEVLGTGVNDFSAEPFIVVVVVASFVALPLLIVRLFQVAIAFDASPVVPVAPIQFSIRHLMIFTFVIACLSTIGKLVLPMLVRGQIGDLLFVAGACCIISIPSVLIILGTNWSTVGSIGVLAVGIGAGYYLGYGQGRTELLGMAFTATEALSVVVSLLVVRRCGYRLVRLPKSTHRGSGLAEFTKPEIGSPDTQSSSLPP